mmetsp:Transcript_27840/g.99095  ORF Transcript_27840/g.99095 Transcript_27840/m.99095 type:complete len:312 (-) Transcript_27840:956-1891(-)
MIRKLLVDVRVHRGVLAPFAHRVPKGREHKIHDISVQRSRPAREPRSFSKRAVAGVKCAALAVRGAAEPPFDEPVQNQVPHRDDDRAPEERKRRCAHDVAQRFEVQRQKVVRPTVAALAVHAAEDEAEEDEDDQQLVEVPFVGHAFDLVQRRDEEDERQAERQRVRHEVVVIFREPDVEHVAESDEQNRHDDVQRRAHGVRVAVKRDFYRRHVRVAPSLDNQLDLDGRIGVDDVKLVEPVEQLGFHADQVAQVSCRAEQVRHELYELAVGQARDERLEVERDFERGDVERGLGEDVAPLRCHSTASGAARP